MFSVDDRHDLLFLLAISMYCSVSVGFPICGTLCSGGEAVISEEAFAVSVSFWERFL